LNPWGRQQNSVDLLKTVLYLSVNSPLFLRVFPILSRAFAPASDRSKMQDLEDQRLDVANRFSLFREYYDE